MDIIDAAVVSIANDDYNHVPENVLFERVKRIRNTHLETKLHEQADIFIEAVREALAYAGDPEYGEEGEWDDPEPRCDICGRLMEDSPAGFADADWNGETGNHETCER